MKTKLILLFLLLPAQFSIAQEHAFLLNANVNTNRLNGGLQYLYLPRKNFFIEASLDYGVMGECNSASKSSKLCGFQLLGPDGSVDWPYGITGYTPYLNQKIFQGFHSIMKGYKTSLQIGSFLKFMERSKLKTFVGFSYSYLWMEDDIRLSYKINGDNTMYYDHYLHKRQALSVGATIGQMYSWKKLIMKYKISFPFYFPEKNIYYQPYAENIMCGLEPELSFSFGFIIN